MKRKIFLYTVLIIISVFTVFFIFRGIGSENRLPEKGSYRTIIDMDDSRIEVPSNPARIACMHGVSSERIIVLGEGGRLVLSMKASPWMLKLYPEIEKSQAIAAPFTGDVERMLKLKVDLVLYSPYPGEAEKYRAAGIKTACGFSPQKRPRTFEDYADNFKRQFIFFGELLSPAAKERSLRYCRYFDEKVAQIRKITSSIDKDKRPTVYFGGRSGNPLLSQGRASVMHWNTEVSGGNFLPQAMDSNFVEVNMEQVYAWNPEIIILSGWCKSTDIVKNNPNWRYLRAVRSGKVYLMPEGVFTWDHASGESVLLMLYMAKIFHPDLFKDLDMIKEMKHFYTEIYGRKITDADAGRILNHQHPI
ncbi:MAG TPA: ABC transporter substrate-binding protein [Spirochaetota bacterium]|nr:ABC transporter substrate-binding protein [Spirochaetota bacterium]HPJ43349.1 ABC transporter substrate-binding protein [Spirochaetota bacterium]HPR37385.1 ABC transporter substrate-binding protein [Spirochaetota bacterium]HRX46397.1 ABC transporter substrate-binding protein [Spirochaetota bacterium]